MAKEKDVFGFDEFNKALDTMCKRYDTKSDAILAAQARQAQRRVTQLTPISSKNKDRKYRLKPSWRVLKVKEYPNDVKVSRIQSKANHGHLYELGHEMVTVGVKKKGFKSGKTKKYNKFGRAALGIKSHGRVPGRFILEKSIHELRSKYPAELQKLVDEIAKEQGLDI